VSNPSVLAHEARPSAPAKAKIRNTPELNDQRSATMLYVFGL
jgi:hypothetical protein